MTGQMQLCAVDVDERCLDDIRRTVLEAIDVLGAVTVKQAGTIAYRLRGWQSLLTVPREWIASAGKRVLAALATVPNIERSARGMQEAVYARLDGPERRVLQVLVHSYPDPLTKQECGTQAGYTIGDRVGGTFGNILGRLRSLGLIDYPSPGTVAALEVLFPLNDQRLEPRS